MNKFEAITENQMQAVMAGFSPAPLAGADAAARDFDMANKLDGTADKAEAAGDVEWATYCRARAAKARARAIRHMGGPIVFKA